MKTEYSISKYIRITFYILVAVMFIGLFLAQIICPSEREPGSEPSRLTYEGILFWEKQDGTREQITVPGTYDVEPGETMVVTTILPEDYAENAVMIRGSQQSVRFYIDGELRYVYDTKETRPFGSESTSRYVFCETSSKDAGKELRIELLSNSQRYSGVVNQIFCGDKADIWSYLLNNYGRFSIIALFILFTGIITIIFSVALSTVYKIRIPLEYLGWCMILGAMWMVGESKLRQLYMPNASSLSSVCFVIVMIAPVPILFYVDSIQQGRYKKFFGIIEWIAVLNLVISSILQFAEIADYLDMLYISHCILGIAIFAVFITFYLDHRKGRVGEYRLVVVGLLVSMTGVLAECLSVYFMVHASEFFLCAGMLILLFFTIINTVREIRDREEKRQMERIEERRKQTEAMSLQLIQTLSVLIESKDEYTKGHSYRVAEYSALIAKAMGWDDSAVENIRNAAYLHDIGKIGIPDIILNKPTKLLDAEYDIIKQHAAMGANILDNITLVPHAREVARHHHERYDGRGYPDGLCGEEIPVYARIVAVADSYDAMNSKRIYRNALSAAKIRKEINTNKGIQFDPVVADTFLKILDAGEVQIAEQDHPLFDVSAMTEPEMSGTQEAIQFISEVVDTMNSQKDVQNIDLLTGLSMRNIGEKQIAEEMQEHAGCLAFFDLDNLKKINDIYGHTSGDRVLKLLGETISDCAGRATTCRLGGDEFLIFLPDLTRDEVDELVKSIFGRFAAKKENEIEFQEASLSGGLCMSKKGDSFEDCYAKADKALYYTKQNGKNNYSFYHQIEMNDGKPGTAERDLEKIAKALERSGSYVGALGLNNREFSKIYEYVSNLGERYNHSCHLVMITMDAVTGSTMFIEEIEQALQCMETAIRGNIRNVDVCTRYSSMQYLVILMEADPEKIPFIMERIFNNYYKHFGKDDLIPHYELREMWSAGDE
ncbi:MAG: HD domain-containing phosphohydrolase [Lachnospiraceae bacterium]